MKKSWSSKWKGSSQRRKQRKYRHNAPLHVKHKFMGSNLSPELRKRFGKRSMPVRKGDEVEIMRGNSKGVKGTVERVSLKSCAVYLEGLNVKKVDGSEVLKPVQPSNMRILSMNMDDKARQMVVDRAKKRETEKAKDKAEPGKQKAPGQDKEVKGR